MSVVYPIYFRLKFWLKTSTPLARVGGFHLNQGAFSGAGGPTLDQFRNNGKNNRQA